MPPWRDRLGLAIAAHQEGRYDESLTHILDIQRAALEREPTLKPPEFIVLFAWSMLAEQYAPARAALAAHRDAQVARLLAGDIETAGRSPGYPQSRFSTVVQLNETLCEEPATYTLFLALRERMPEHAAACAWQALPAIIDAGDFALAEPYMPDPLAWLPYLNEQASLHPLFPPQGGAPRLAAELSNYAKEVRQRAAILAGLERHDEAAALRTAAIAGIAQTDMRLLARRDIEAPGAIMRALSRHQAGHDAPGPAH